jgi:sulfite oxidase
MQYFLEGRHYLTFNLRVKLRSICSPPEQEYSAEDVRQHGTPDTGIWASYRSGVYDITRYVPLHPGGDIILQAAGGY